MIRHPARAATLLAVAAALPAVVSGILAVRGGWEPVIDNAVIAVRTHDVLGGHLPLHGPYTSLTAVADSAERLYHLGPLENWVLAVPARLGGPSGAGLVVAASLLNAAAAAGAVWVGYRIGKLRVAAIAAAATALMSWSLGGQVLHDAWPQHLSLFAFLFLLFASWGIARGDVWLLPLAVLAASFVIQLYLPFLALAGLVVVWAVAALAWHLRRRRRALDPDAWVETRRRAQRAGVTAAAVGLLCWSGPIVDQIFGDGNLVRVVRTGITGDYRTVGATIAWRDLVHASSLAPDWASPITAQVKADTAPAAWEIVAALAVLGALVAVTVFAISRRRVITATAGLTALVACVGAAWTTANAPVAYRYTEFVYPRRIWWPVGIFLWVALAEAATAFVAARWRTRAARWDVAAAVAGVAAVAIALLAAWPRLGAEQDYGSGAFDAVRSLARPVDQVARGARPWHLRTRGDFAHALVGPGLTSELQYRGRDVLVDRSVFPDYGDSHLFNPDRDVGGTLLVVSDDTAGDPVPGYRLVAQWDPKDTRHESYRQSLLAVPITPVAVYARDSSA